MFKLARRAPKHRREFVRADEKLLKWSGYKMREGVVTVGRCRAGLNHSTPSALRGKESGNFVWFMSD